MKDLYRYMQDLTLTCFTQLKGQFFFFFPLFSFSCLLCCLDKIQWRFAFSFSISVSISVFISILHLHLHFLIFLCYCALYLNPIACMPAHLRLAFLSTFNFESSNDHTSGFTCWLRLVLSRCGLYPLIHPSIHPLFQPFSLL